MNRLLCAILSILAAVPAFSQPVVRKTFTGMGDSMSHIPAYEEGKTFYLNPYAGGQSGNMVILKEAPGKYRIWDNASQLWVSESFEDISVLFFINPNMLFIGKQNDRCIILHTSLLDGFKPEDKYLWFTDWRFWMNSRKEIEYVMLSLGGKWGLMGPNGNFLVPTRYDTPEAARDALKDRKAAEKPLGMSEMDFIISEIQRMNHPRESIVLDNLYLDWEWYDPVSGSLFYTLEQLPWAGPYCRFTGDFTFEFQPLEEGERHCIWNATLGVEDNVLSHIVNPNFAAHPGKLFPLTDHTARSLNWYKPASVSGSRGDIFYGTSVEKHPGMIFGLRLNKDTSFQVGYFIGSKNADGSVTIQKYYCADEGTRYIDFLRDYACSEHNKNGYDPTDAEVVEAFRKYICPCSIENHFVPDDWGDYYDKEKGTLKLRFIPLCEADVPTSRATADAFVKEFRRAYYGDGREDYDVYFERKVRDNGEIFIDNLSITSPSGIHLEYKAQ